MTMAANPSTSQVRRQGRSLRLVNQAKGRAIKVANSVAASMSAMLLPTMRSVRARIR